jgi:excisionase family DNA binding protein
MIFVMSGRIGTFPMEKELKIMNSNEPITTTVEQAEKLTGLSRSSLYRLAKVGKIILLKAGRRVLVDMASIRQYLNTLPRA